MSRASAQVIERKGGFGIVNPEEQTIKKTRWIPFGKSRKGEPRETRRMFGSTMVWDPGDFSGNYQALGVNLLSCAFLQSKKKLFFPIHADSSGRFTPA